MAASLRMQTGLWRMKEGTSP